MTVRTRRVTVLTSVIGAGGLLLAGCAGGQATTTTPAGGSGADASVSNSVSAMQAKEDKLEDMIADCMKQRGFTYVAHPSVVDDSSGRSANWIRGTDPALVPYAQLKTFREKYGFGIYSADVYPHDPQVAMRRSDPSANPNNAIIAALSPAQKQAYDVAMNGPGPEAKAGQPAPPSVPAAQQGCAEKASLAVYGDSSQNAQAQQQQAASSDAAYRDFQTNPQLVAAAQTYASCLRQQGYQVSSALPGDVDRVMQQTVLQQRRNAGGDTIDANTARAGLQNEIKMALADLECGKSYEALAKPFVQKLQTMGAG